MVTARALPTHALRKEQKMNNHQKFSLNTKFFWIFGIISILDLNAKADLCFKEVSYLMQIQHFAQNSEVTAPQSAKESLPYISEYLSTENPFSSFRNPLLVSDWARILLRKPYPKSHLISLLQENGLLR